MFTLYKKKKQADPEESGSSTSTFMTSGTRNAIKKVQADPETNPTVDSEMAGDDIVFTPESQEPSSSDSSPNTYTTSASRRPNRIKEVLPTGKELDEELASNKKSGDVDTSGSKNSKKHGPCIFSMVLPLRAIDAAVKRILKCWQAGRAQPTQDPTVPGDDIVFTPQESELQDTSSERFESEWSRQQSFVKPGLWGRKYHRTEARERKDPVIFRSSSSISCGSYEYSGFSPDDLSHHTPKVRNNGARRVVQIQVSSTSLWDYSLAPESDLVSV
jgi:hypothetical protein